MKEMSRWTLIVHLVHFNLQVRVHNGKTHHKHKAHYSISLIAQFHVCNTAGEIIGTGYFTPAIEQVDSFGELLDHFLD